MELLCRLDFGCLPHPLFESDLLESDLPYLVPRISLVDRRGFFMPFGSDRGGPEAPRRSTEAPRWPPEGLRGPPGGHHNYNQACSRLQREPTFMVYINVEGPLRILGPVASVEVGIRASILHDVPCFPDFSVDSGAPDNQGMGTKWLQSWSTGLISGVCSTPFLAPDPLATVPGRSLAENDR